MSWELHGESQLAFRDVRRVLINNYRYSDIVSVSWSLRGAGRGKSGWKTSIQSLGYDHTVGNKGGSWPAYLLFNP